MPNSAPSAHLGNRTRYWERLNQIVEERENSKPWLYIAEFISFYFVQLSRKQASVPSGSQGGSGSVASASGSVAGQNNNVDTSNTPATNGIIDDVNYSEVEDNVVTPDKQELLKHLKENEDDFELAILKNPDSMAHTSTSIEDFIASHIIQLRLRPYKKTPPTPQDDDEDSIIYRIKFVDVHETSVNAQDISDYLHDHADEYELVVKRPESLPPPLKGMSTDSNMLRILTANARHGRSAYDDLRDLSLTVKAQIKEFESLQKEVLEQVREMKREHVQALINFSNIKANLVERASLLNRIRAGLDEKDAKVNATMAVLGEWKDAIEKAQTHRMNEFRWMQAHASPYLFSDASGTHLRIDATIVTALKTLKPDIFEPTTDFSCEINRILENYCNEKRQLARKEGQCVQSQERSESSSTVNTAAQESQPTEVKVEHSRMPVLSGASSSETAAAESVRTEGKKKRKRKAKGNANGKGVQHN